MFYMNMRAFNEGEQAEKYKANKAYEKAKERKEELDRQSKRYNSNTNWHKHAERVAKEKGRDLTTDEKMNIANQHYPLGELGEKDNYKADKSASDFNSKAFHARYGNPDLNNHIKARPMTDEEYRRATDAANRHDRRHPKNECGIFESVKFI